MAVAPEEKQKRRTKLVRVKQAYIDCIIRQRREPRCRRPVFSPLSYETRSLVYRDEPEELERARAALALAAAIIEGRQDKEDEILRQYHANGFAMEEVEVSDGEEEDDGRCGQEA